MKENFSVLFSEQTIQKRIKELAEEITHDYLSLESPPVIIAMLKGSTYFLSDLTRQIDLPLRFDFISISKVQASSSSIDMIKDIEVPIKNKHVLVLEEIVRSGLTTHYMLEHIEKMQPKSIRLAALLANPDQLMIDLPLTYIGFKINYERVIGYGMDLKEDYRNLKFIAKLEQ